ncbi:hypothetical protein VN97_g1372 [Penicillium thymicola]|uniref:Uncharacterized protein n=1 Tax=Penicillium thymicola TaxID=293382 RepID=A0AAI9TR40_PENTH|nr:hypothetical protein VN97_g1372 [Penicillium thymicola]
MQDLRPKDQFAALVATSGKLNEADIEAVYNKLPALPIDFREEWMGETFDTGHPGHTQLLSMNRLGKAFHFTESVDPIVVSKDGKRVCDETRGHAVCSFVRFVSQTCSTAMIYDMHPIIDHSRYVHDNLIAGAMDIRSFGDAGTYYSYLYK